MANVNRYLKLASESTFKQAAALTPDLVLYTKSATVKPLHNEIEIKTGYKRGAQMVGPGMVSSEVNFETAADLNQLAFLLNKALSGYLSTDLGPASPTTHEFYSDEKYVLNSFQAFAGMDDHEAISRGVGINTLSIGVSGGELNISASAIGSTYLKSAIDTLDASDFDNLDFLTFADVIVKLDGVNISCPETKEFTININNGMSLEDGQRVGSRERCLNLAGDLEVTVDFTLYRNSTQFLEAYLGDTNTFGTNGSTTHKLEFIITDPKNGDSMSIVVPEARITSHTYDTAGNDIVDESATFKANLGNVTAFDGVTVLETMIYAKMDKDLPFTL